MNGVAHPGPNEPRPVFPALGPLYVWSRDLSYPVIRLAAGGMLLAHGIAKLMTVSVGTFAVTGLARRGIEPSLPLAYVVFFEETVGAVCIMVGLLTRFFAAAAVIEFAVITIVAHGSFGFWWTRPGGGWEYPLLWGLMFFAIAMRGGGPYSLDRRIGWEL
jgi:putative oxidoreductase